MTQLKHSYYFVRGHLDNDYFEEVTDDLNQEDFIQETCDGCGDNDWIEGEFDTYEDLVQWYKNVFLKKNKKKEKIAEG